MTLQISFDTSASLNGRFATWNLKRRCEQASYQLLGTRPGPENLTLMQRRLGGASCGAKRGDLYLDAESYPLRLFSVQSILGSKTTTWVKASYHHCVLSCRLNTLSMRSVCIPYTLQYPAAPLLICTTTGFDNRGSRFIAYCRHRSILETET